MKKILILTAVLTASVTMTFGQKYFTRTGHANFFSHAALEDISADNKNASLIIDSSTGELVSKMLMKSFVFEKALMQEHFNENYIESDKFPKAVLKGKIVNASDLDFSSSEIQPVVIEGTVSLHGIEKPYTIKGTIQYKKKKLVCKAKFEMKPKDHKIEIPQTVAGNIAESIVVTVNFELDKR